MLKIKYRSMKQGRKTIDSLLSHNGTRIEVSTGITLPTGVEFVQPRTFIGGNSNTRAKIEQDLHDWEETIRNKYNSLIATHGMVFSADVFRSGMKLTVAEARGEDVVSMRTTLSALVNKFSERLDSGLAARKATGTPYSQSSVDNLKSCVEMINAYIVKHGDFDFAKYNMDTEATLGKSVVISAYDDLCQRIKSFMITDRKYGMYTIKDLTTRTKFIIREMCEVYGINLSNRYMAKMKYTAPSNKAIVAMSQDQFEWLISNEDRIRNDHSHLRVASAYIDFLIAGLMTAARISDLNRLTVNNLIKTDEGYLLQYIPQKTKNSSGLRVEIPITNKLAKMFLENAERFDGKLLRLNRKGVKSASDYLRPILRKYEIFQNMVHTQDKHGNIVVKPFWKAFRFHSTRASLITYLLSKGEQETVIKSISGHTLDSSSFKCYTNITNNMKQRTMQRLALIGAD